MAKEIRSWEANDGSLHKTECEAAARDLQIIIGDSPCAENSPYAKTMFDWMKRGARDIAVALIAYADACPQEETAADPPPPSRARRLEVLGIAIRATRESKDRARPWLRANNFADLSCFNEDATDEQIASLEEHMGGQPVMLHAERIADHTPSREELERID